MGNNTSSTRSTQGGGNHTTSAFRRGTGACVMNRYTFVSVGEAAEQSIAAGLLVMPPCSGEACGMRRRRQ